DPILAGRVYRAYLTHLAAVRRLMTKRASVPSVEVLFQTAEVIERLVTPLSGSLRFIRGRVAGVDEGMELKDELGKPNRLVGIEGSWYCDFLLRQLTRASGPAGKAGPDKRASAVTTADAVRVRAREGLAHCVERGWYLAAALHHLILGQI